MQPTPDEVHEEGYLARRKRKKERKAEEVVYKRDVGSDERKDLASKGHALSDGSYPIANTGDLANAAHLAASGHGNAAAAKRLIAKRAQELGVKNPLQKAFDEVTPIWKSDEQRIIYGVAMAPERVDSQGDTVSKEEIERAAHAFLVHRRATDVQHSEEQVPVDVIESFVAPHDMTIAGKLVTGGSWVMAHKVHDDEIWADIKAERITGLSIGGSAIRSED